MKAAWLPLQGTRLASESPARLTECSLLSPYLTERGGLYPTRLLQGPFIVSAEKRALLGKDMALLLPKPAAEAGKEGRCPASAHVSPLTVKGGWGSSPHSDAGAEVVLIWADTHWGASAGAF